MKNKFVKECELFVKKLHKGQVDKSGKDYYHHLYEVAKNAKDLCEKFGYDEFVNDCVLIGLLHDSIEDCNLDVEVIKEKYGVEVANGVLLMTKDEKAVVGKDERENPLFDLKYVGYLVNLYKEYKKGNEVAKKAMIVKMADLKSNMNWKRLVENFDELSLNQKKSVAKYHFAYCMLMSVLVGTFRLDVRNFELVLKSVKFDPSNLEKEVSHFI